MEAFLDAGLKDRHALVDTFTLANRVSEYGIVCRAGYALHMILLLVQQSS